MFTEPLGPWAQRTVPGPVSRYTSQGTCPGQLPSWASCCPLWARLPIHRETAAVQTVPNTLFIMSLPSAGRLLSPQGLGENAQFLPPEFLNLPHSLPSPPHTPSPGMRFGSICCVFPCPTLSLQTHHVPRL